MTRFFKNWINFLQCRTSLQFKGNTLYPFSQVSCAFIKNYGLVQNNIVTFQEMRKEVWGFKEDVITFLDDELIGGHEQFLKWAMENYGYKDFRFYNRENPP